MNKNDRIIGIVLILVAIYMFYYVNVAEYNQFGDDPGPTLLPLIIATGLTICGLGLVFWPKKQVDTETEDEQATGETTGEPRNVRKGVIIAVSIVTYVLLLQFVGFIISTIVFMVFAINYLAEIRTRKSMILSVAISAVVTLSVFFVFEHYLRIFLP